MSARATRLLLAAIAAGTLTAEALLAERKFGILAGGFGQSHVVDTPAERLLLGACVGAAHAVLLLVAYRMLRALHARREGAWFAFDLAAVTGGVFVAALIAKFEVLAYFSDAVSFQLIRNLGGGSLFDAFLFALSEGGLMLAGLGIGLIGYGLGLWFIRRRWPRPAPSPPVAGWRTIAALAAIVAALVLAANRTPDVRLAADRFTAFGLAADLLDRATDLDGDGYGLFGRHPDPHPLDAARHPLALDIPGNAIDEDGFGGDFRFAPPPAARPAPPLGPRPKHLIVVVFESTRGDVIGKRVNGRIVAPNLEALAAAGSRWPRAYSHVGFTTASLKSLFGGALDPADDRQSLFADLKRAGYRIGVFSGQPETFGDIAQVVGMQRNADVFADADTMKAQRALSFAAKGSLRIDEKHLLAAFDRAFGDPAGWRRPTFAYLNFQAPHFPYNHPGLPATIEPHPLPREAITASNADAVARTYWNAVAYSDRRLGDLIATLKAKRVWADTLMVVLADHGEALFETGFLGHGHVLDETQTHIPLVASVPGRAGDAPVGLSDIRAIILDTLAGRPPAPPAGPVFQYIGTIDRPAAIAIVERGGRTELDLETRDVRIDDGAAVPLDHLRGAERARADRLIENWRRERWLRHLAGRE